MMKKGFQRECPEKMMALIDNQSLPFCYGLLADRNINDFIVQSSYDYSIYLTYSLLKY